MTVEFAASLAKMEITNILKDLNARTVKTTLFNLDEDKSALIKLDNVTMRVVDKVFVRYNNTLWDNKRIAFSVKYDSKKAKDAWIMITRVTEN